MTHKRLIITILSFFLFINTHSQASQGNSAVGGIHAVNTVTFLAAAGTTALIAAEVFIPQLEQNAGADLAALPPATQRWITSMFVSGITELSMAAATFLLTLCHPIIGGGAANLTSLAGLGLGIWQLVALFIAAGDGDIVADVGVKIFYNSLIFAGAALLTLCLTMPCVGGRIAIESGE